MRTSLDATTEPKTNNRRSPTMSFRVSRFTILAALALLAAVAARAGDSAEAASSKKININQASSAQLANLPRVGAKVADRIVEYRKAHGQFGQAEELME